VEREMAATLGDTERGIGVRALHFGGQVNLHASHRVLMSCDLCVFVLVFDPRRRRS